MWIEVYDSTASFGRAALDILLDHSVVAELSQILLDRGHRFCCLFADAKNTISCGIYRKIGYENQCIMDELKFREIL